MNRRNGQLEPSSDTINPRIDTIKPRNDIINHHNETIDSSNETIDSINETIDSSNDTIKPSIDTINSSNGTIKASIDRITSRNETINSSNGTIKINDTSKAAQKEEMIKKVKVRVREIVVKKHKKGKIIDRKIERLTEVLTMLAGEEVKITRAELVAQFGSTASTMHREMKILKKAGLVRFRGSRKSGTFVLRKQGRKW